jgi:hypothetical protein
MLALVICTVVPALGRAAEQGLEQFVEQVLQIDTDQALLQLGDRSFHYTNFLIVQDYLRDPDQRLPLKSVTVGSWVLIDAQYSPELRSYIARRLQLLPSATVAKKLHEDLQPD